MEVDIIEMPALRVGVVRSDMAHVREAQEQLEAIAGKDGLVDQPGVVRASFMPVDVIRHGPQAGTRYDAGAIVPEDLALPEGLTEDRVPGGRYARAIHVGSYEGLGDAWGRFTGEWLPSSGRQVADGVCYEIYRDNPADVPESELRTELYIPVA